MHANQSPRPATDQLLQQWLDERAKRPNRDWDLIDQQAANEGRRPSDYDGDTRWAWQRSAVREGGNRRHARVASGPDARRERRVYYRVIGGITLTTPRGVVTID